MKSFLGIVWICMFWGSNYRWISPAGWNNTGNKGFVGNCSYSIRKRSCSQLGNSDRRNAWTKFGRSFGGWTKLEYFLQKKIVIRNDRFSKSEWLNATFRISRFYCKSHKISMSSQEIWQLVGLKRWLAEEKVNRSIACLMKSSYYYTEART